eukprot:scaffold63783_cov24-Attheya_sp.AAC.1
MFAYVTVRSLGMDAIWLGLNILKVSVPIAPVRLSPCASVPHYLPNAVCHTTFNSGSFDTFLYEEMISPDVGWITGAQKCSIPGEW